MLVYPSSMPVSNRALQVLADALRQRRSELGSRWRRLPAGRQALLVLAHWLAKFEFDPVPDHKVEVFSDMTLKPLGGMPLRVYQRLG